MARCGPTFIPVLPTWNLEVQIFKWNGTSRVRELPDITAQVQGQDQSAGEGPRATAYLRHRKEDDRLRDPWDYGDGTNPNATDAVSFLLPSGRRVYYLVREVQAKNAGFPNAHMQTTIVKSNHVDIPAPPPDPPPPPPDEEFSCALTTWEFDSLTADADGVAQINSILTARWSDGQPVEGLLVFFSADPPTVLSVPYAFTNVDGEAEVSFSSAVDSTPTVTAIVEDCEKTQALTFGEGGSGGSAGGDWHMHVEGVTDGTCDGEEYLNVNFIFDDMPEVPGAVQWNSLNRTFSSGCDYEPVILIIIHWDHSPGVARAIIADSSLDDLAIFFADIDTWDFSSPLDFDFASSIHPGDFNWPATIQLRPGHP